MRKDYQPELIAAILVLAFIAMWFTSCMTPQKATSYLKEKGLLADTCAANYPVQSKRDTTIVERKVVDQDVLDSLAKVNAELQQKLDYINGLPPVIDSSTCQELRAKYAADIRKYQQKVNRLEERLSELKARDTTFKNTDIDSAKLAAANRKTSLLEKQIKDTEAELFKAEDKAKDRGKTSLYSIVGNGLLLLLLGFILAKKRKP